MRQPKQSPKKTNTKCWDRKVTGKIRKGKCIYFIGIVQKESSINDLDISPSNITLSQAKPKEEEINKKAMTRLQTRRNRMFGHTKANKSVTDVKPSLGEYIT